jgi:hypothetical protein
MRPEHLALPDAWFFRKNVGETPGAFTDEIKLVGIF